MRKGFWVTLYLIAVPVAGYAQEAGRPPDIVQNATWHFQVMNPEHWSAKKSRSDNAILLVSPKQGQSDAFLENVSIYAEDLTKTPGKTLNDCRDRFLKSIEKGIEGFEFRSNEPAIVDGQPAFEMIYVGRVKNRAMKWKTIVTMKNSKVYVLNYTADDRDYFNQLEAANKILYSFRFI